ncbi:ABC-2 type transport system ATP-binding protein [Kitasatospora sp. MAA4]|uniref:ATP-binding cassette domain-containing protein n=1 Tax=Kitasatospora sp. MAA4 TaxID=3035093 RepID=UPI00247554F6|nr:ATP-binding cassette domain-containing protein [Kitasatospora sp. MAA4]MDH6133790.1 ABC-2 type transport system ATP-binding protein [Kitasatospora sp. MAA4]
MTRLTAPPPSEVMIEAHEVSKVYGTVRALDSVSISARRGTVLALLGHNGAGKTTLVGILTAALPPTSGRAAVAGFDVASRPREIRQRIGLTGQFASVDGQLSGRENLVLLARLLGAGRKAARARADELLELFALGEVATRRAQTYSGGLRRRLDLAASLVGHPEVIFLDEPTTGLDPSSRINLWEIVEGLVAEGTTVLLTTQYLDEADRLADSITVLSSGAVIASGTAAELKASVGQRTVTVTLDGADDPALAVAALREAAMEPVTGRQDGAIVIPIAASRDIAAVVRALDNVGIEAAELSFGEPSLDDVYLTLAEQPARLASPSLALGATV